HVSILQAHVVPDLLKRAGVEEGGYAVGPGLYPRAGDSAGDSNHVLLSDTRVDKTIAHGGFEGFQCHESQIPSQEDKGAFFGELDQSLAGRVSHAPISFCACSCWDSVRGR